MVYQRRQEESVLCFSVWLAAGVTTMAVRLPLTDNGNDVTTAFVQPRPRGPGR